MRNLHSANHRVRTSQPRGTCCAHSESVRFQGDLDVLRVHARKSKYELKALCGLLDVYGRFPHGSVHPGAHIAGKPALHAVRPVQKLTGLGPHPPELTIDAHLSRGLGPTSQKKRFIRREGEWAGVK